jgi:hypothetical protein
MTRDSSPVPRARLSVLRGRIWRLRDRRIRVKLAVILALPVLAVLVLTTSIGGSASRHRR